MFCWAVLTPSRLAARSIPRDLKFSRSRDSTVASVARVDDFRLMIDIMAKKLSQKTV